MQFILYINQNLISYCLYKWEEFTSKKPDPDKNHPEDEKFLAEAIQNIGDYKLKEADDYKAPPEVRDTTVKKYKQVLDTRLKVH